MSFIFADENLVFNIALTVMVAIAILEVLGALVGFAISHALDSMLPEMDFDIDADISGAASFNSFLGWLHVGRVPVLIIFIVFLASFGILGLLTQKMLVNATGQMYSGSILALPVFLASLPCVHLIGKVARKLFPQDETEAVSESSFIGMPGVVTLGNGTRGNPTQARITDHYGQDHYILVEPRVEGETLSHQNEIVIVDRTDKVYLAELKRDN